MPEAGVIALRLCPFCGGVPVWFNHPDTPRRTALACRNPRCPVQPHTPWRDRADPHARPDAVAAWNHRCPEPTPPAPPSAMAELLRKIHGHIAEIEALDERKADFPESDPPCE